jgi:hypothetical protein
MAVVTRVVTGKINNGDVDANADIAASKVIHNQTIDSELFGPTTSVAALTKLLHIAKSSGTIQYFRAIVVTPATGADRTVTVDLKKSTGGGAMSTVLSGTIGFTNLSTAFTDVSGTLSSADYVEGDVFEAVVTVAGAAGNQALGLLISLSVTPEYA